MPPKVGKDPYQFAVFSLMLHKSRKTLGRKLLKVMMVPMIKNRQAPASQTPRLRAAFPTYCRVGRTGRSGDPSGLFLTADANHSLYNRGFRWSHVHEQLQVTGRTRILRRNYRSTRQIAHAAAEPDGPAGWADRARGD